MLVTGTFPGTNTQISSKEHVEKSRDLVRDIETKALPNDHVPSCSKPFVQGFFNHLSGLQQETCLDENTFLSLYRLIIIEIFLTGVCCNLHHFCLG